MNELMEGANRRRRGHGQTSEQMTVPSKSHTPFSSTVSQCQHRSPLNCNSSDNLAHNTLMPTPLATVFPSSLFFLHPVHPSTFFAHSYNKYHSMPLCMNHYIGFYEDNTTPRWIWCNPFYPLSKEIRKAMTHMHTQNT